MENGRLLGALKIAVLIPCYNEEASIQKVVADYKASLPEATVYVYDNNSQDRTVILARSGGAIVRSETLQGKGNVVRRMFADVDADAYVLVDGDDTYDAEAATGMLWTLVDQQLDMVTGIRANAGTNAYRLGHHWGNKVLTGLVRFTFGKRSLMFCQDIESLVVDSSNPSPHWQLASRRKLNSLFMHSSWGCLSRKLVLSTAAVSLVLYPNCEPSPMGYASWQ